MERTKGSQRKSTTVMNRQRRMVEFTKIIQFKINIELLGDGRNINITLDDN